ncbi:methyltransferase domain-containing protein [Flavobacterium crassostreae]|uniref:Thiopurine S-methyltransferase n=1 Tax=Flavobacterium crassostreae TaxID=1763534 RepID=A0A1B9E9C2_9FLAO|nr:methyltransferase domain-containing protein [Flavobacterium crassostreae]OCB78536.1 thiopurine S-methyltransferase [Flavobacterium crassostreae]
MNNTSCCTVACEQPLDQKYWDAQYQANTTGWDLGQISPPMRAYIDRIQNKNSAILIPGCGNTYEAAYLSEQGFTNITVLDIAPSLVKILQEKFMTNTNIQVLLGDFFAHQGLYDIILEQTFLCALPPSLRQKYVYKMHDLLTPNGILAGVLFNRSFAVGPPFGGSQAEYEMLFKGAFRTLKAIPELESVAPRSQSELAIELQKNSAVSVSLYTLEGVSCIDCKNEILKKLQALDTIQNASISTDFKTLLLVTEQQIAVAQLQKTIASSGQYSISKITL